MLRMKEIFVKITGERQESSRKWISGISNGQSKDGKEGSFYLERTTGSQRKRA